MIVDFAIHDPHPPGHNPHAHVPVSYTHLKEGDPFWTKAETLLYCALIAYIIFEGPAEDRNMNTLVDMISGMEVKEEDDEMFIRDRYCGDCL